MTQVDTPSDTLTEDYWHETLEETLPTYVTPVVEESKLARFFNSLAASMMLQQRQRVTLDQRHVLTSPTDLLAQNYPHLYLRVMCG